MLPGRLGAAHQILRAHVVRLEDHVLSIVELPIARQQPPIALVAFEERGRGKRRQHREARQVDLRLDDELRGALKDLRCVVIEAEYEAPWIAMPWR